MTSNSRFKALNRAESPIFDLFIVFLVISGAILR